ncbi:MAG: hypothetical protein WAL63_11025 [Solirubrobacteraceae bacterium]
MTLLLRTGLVTAVAVPVSGALGLFTAWFVERTRDHDSLLAYLEGATR